MEEDLSTDLQFEINMNLTKYTTKSKDPYRNRILVEIKA